MKGHKFDWRQKQRPKSRRPPPFRPLHGLTALRYATNRGLRGFLRHHYGPGWIIPWANRPL